MGSLGLFRNVEQQELANSIHDINRTVDDAGALLNAMAEALNSLFKAELVRNHGPWRDVSHVEVAIAEWVDWYNHRRLHGEIGHVPPVEFEAVHAEQPARALTSISR